MFQPIFQKLLFLIRSPLVLWFSLCAHRSNLLKLSTITWAAQMRALVNFPENCGNSPDWSYFSWYTDTPAPGLLSVYFHMYPDSLPLFLHILLLAATNIHDTQRVTSSFKYINSDRRTQSFSSLNMHLGWRWYNFPCQDLNSCCKVDSTSGNMMFSIYSCVRLFDSFIQSYE